ncbi:MAG TPA: class I SAM-dependent methyltransferase [Kiloniellaceae bacterium]|nr:class I SAM-dependent methyltransferase [Kiloniellaceae bacterium]
MRAWLRTARFGIPTVLGLAKRGFFIPYRYAGLLPAGGPSRCYGAVEERLQSRREVFYDWLQRLSRYEAAFAAIGGDPAPAPRWAQSWFPRLDAAMAYGLLRELKPRLVMEVGSGHSTRFLCRAVADGGLETKILAIDPAPRASLAASGVELLRQPLHEAAPAPVERLAAGDFLMIDSSHILMPGSDVDYLLGHVLPRLPAGVLVQFHDIFLPDDYPVSWAWRGYNEQQGVLPLILSGDWEVIFASRFVATRAKKMLADSVVGSLPLEAEAIESALWLRKLSGADHLTRI